MKAKSHQWLGEEKAGREQKCTGWLPLLAVGRALVC
jgi:hypothetical protein